MAVAGWADDTEIGAHELAERFEGAGVAAIVHTDIGRDGMLKGLNLRRRSRSRSGCRRRSLRPEGFLGLRT